MPSSQVVPGDHDHGDRGDPSERQPREHGEHDHRDADGPDHLHDEPVFVAQAERPAECHHGELEYDQPQTARDQEASELGARAAPAHEPGTDAGQEDEDGRAEVRDPAGEVQREIGLRQVERIAAHAGEVIAHVIERHQHDDQAAQDVDRLQTHTGACVRKRLCEGRCARTLAANASEIRRFD
jgi:hypothetical protein